MRPVTATASASIEFEGPGELLRERSVGRFYALELLMVSGCIWLRCLLSRASTDFILVVSFIS